MRAAFVLPMVAGAILPIVWTPNVLAQVLPKGQVAGKEQDAEKADGKDKESPWLLVPTFSLNPKLGFSLGAMAGYLHYFDKESQVSMFGVSGQYTSTDSKILAAVGKASFDADHQRLLVLLAGGVINNNYEDFLGTGQSLKSTDDLRAFATRYQYRVWDDWFIGVQGLYTNYEMLGQSAFDDQVLNTLGLTGFKSGGIGAIIMHDSRDRENSPTKGWVMNLNNIAYRDWIYGEENFDVYRLDLKGYWEHGEGNVLAVRQNNQWTSDAPPSAYAPVTLRGYKFGQYLGKYMSSIEIEERMRIAQRWTATVFTGIACLYGADEKCDDSANQYPNVGVGVQYILKPEAGIVVNLEYAYGKSGNYAVLLKLGYGF